MERKKSRKQNIVWEELPPKKTRKKETSEPRNNEKLQSEITSTESMKTGVKKIIYIDGIPSKPFKNKSSKCRLIFKFISLLILTCTLGNLTAEAVKHPTSLDDFQPIAGPSLSPCSTAQDCKYKKLL